MSRTRASSHEKARGTNCDYFRRRFVSYGHVSQATCQGRLNYKKKHLQENTAVTGTAQNKSGVYFQEQENVECSRQEVKVCHIYLITCGKAITVPQAIARVEVLSLWCVFR